MPHRRSALFPRRRARCAVVACALADPSRAATRLASFGRLRLLGRPTAAVGPTAHPPAPPLAVLCGGGDSFAARFEGIFAQVTGVNPRRAQRGGAALVDFETRAAVRRTRFAQECILGFALHTPPIDLPPAQGASAEVTVRLELHAPTLVFTLHVLSMTACAHSTPQSTACLRADR